MAKLTNPPPVTRIRNIRYIEVFEWKRDAPRPGTKTKPREDLLDILAIPPNGQIPSTGDVILMSDSSDVDPTRPMKRFRVVEREFLWVRESRNSKKQVWVKMWIHVRRLQDESK